MEAPPLIQQLFLAAISTAFGAVAGAFGVTLAMRTKLEKHDRRFDRIEAKVGINETGVLTGNGLIGTTGYLRTRIERLEGYE